MAHTCPYSTRRPPSPPTAEALTTNVLIPSGYTCSVGGRYIRWRELPAFVAHPGAPMISHSAHRPYIPPRPPARPPPSPVSLAPSAPASLATPTSSSSSVQLQPYRSAQEACESFMRLPSLASRSGYDRDLSCEGVG